MKVEVQFPSSKVDYYLQFHFPEITLLAKGRPVVLLTDENLHAAYPNVFQDCSTIILPSGEEHKSFQSVQYVAEKLLELEADRNCLLIGVGGGMICDLTGFVASVFMRGIPFGFFPTSLLAMVDAAIGGKNGVNLGQFKNMLGVIHQPEFIVFDSSFLHTLPAQEWSNGFAEIIKYACIFDAALWDKLAEHNVAYYANHPDELDILIQQCVAWKNKTVIDDEMEKGMRKLLNFGHTAGHAFENSLKLPHGFAVGLGMLVACIISEKTTGLAVSVRKQLEQLLVQYGLPIKTGFDPDSILEILKKDKKRQGKEIDFIVLDQIGKAVICKVSFSIIHEALVKFNHESSC